MNTRNKLFTIVGTVAVIAAAGAGGYALFVPGDTSLTNVAPTSQTTTSTTSSTTASTTSNTSTSVGYIDGTYTASSSYSVPRGSNKITVTAVVASGKITSVTSDNSYSDRESSTYISNFKSSLASAVTGKSLSSTSYSRIGGASLTTRAFDQALSQIASQAKA